MSKESRQQAERYIHWLREHSSCLYTTEAIDKLTDMLDVAWGQGFDDCGLQFNLSQILNQSTEKSAKIEG